MTVASSEKARNGRNFRSRLFPRHHPRHKLTDDLRLMLAGRAFQRIGPFERIRSRNPHLPAIIRLRSDDRNPPIPRPVRWRVLDDCPNLRPHHAHATRVVQLYRNCHTPENWPWPELKTRWGIRMGRKGSIPSPTPVFQSVRQSCDPLVIR